jgi:MATE family multidrug resistance protein
MAAGLLLLPHLGQPAEVVAAVGPYWLWMAAMLLPFTLSMVPKYLLDSADRAWTSAGLTLIPVALNVALNWVFIYGNLGAPALGLTGAGVASFLATALGAAASWAFVRLHPDFAAWWAAPAGAARESRLQLREGLPMATQYLLEGGGFAVAGVMVGLFGAVALAGNQIVLSVSSTLYMLPLGMSAAVSIRVAQALGGGEPARVRAIGVAGLAAVTAWMGFFALLYVFAGGAIAGAFVDDAAVIAAAAASFTLFGLMQVADGVQSVALGALRGLLDNRWPTVVSLVAYWLLALPLAWVLSVGLGYGPPGIWAGFGVGLACAAVALALRFRALSRAGDAGAPSASA